MRKILSIVVIGMLMLSGFGVFGMAQQEKEDAVVKQIVFSQPNIQTEEKHCTVHLDEADSYVMTTGEPVLPVVTRTFTFPFGTTISDVECSVAGVGEKRVPGRVVAAPEPVPYSSVSVKKTTASQVSAEQMSEVYSSDSLYPKDWMDYRVTVGLEDGRHVVFVNVDVFPVRYSPGDELVKYASEAEVSVEYTLPEQSVVFPDEYDLVIIAPEEFQSNLEPLVTHKEDHGVATNLVTVESIVSDYDGQDAAEKMKYFIKHALEEWGVNYVLLVGGKKARWTGNWGMDGPNGQVNADLWHVPVRYSSLDDQTEAGYLSDLYFADIYKYEDGEAVFDDWDSNDDGIFASWSFQHGKDVMDLNPDVYVGRLACRDTTEVTTVVDKIITYESGADPSWFHNAYLFGGDTFPSEQDPYFEGELNTNHSFGYLPSEFEATKLFTSLDTLALGGNDGELASRLAWINVVQTFNTGCGFAFFAGHASPASSVTHHPHNGDYYVNMINIDQMRLLSNGDRLPVSVVGGCHNSEFNVSFFNFINNPWSYRPTPECWSWTLVRKQNGGSIATIGNTGLGYGSTGDTNDDGIPDCLQYVGGWIESRFAHAYGQQGKEILGEAHGTAIKDYINEFPINDDKIDRKTVEEWCLLGDPSLKIGGYQ